MDGIYEFNHCVPDGDVTIAGVTPGEILVRTYTFRCNVPPKIQQALNSGQFDPRNIIVGSDGELWSVDSAGSSQFLAHVNTWSAVVSFTNSDYSPAGQRIVWAVPQTFTVTLTLEEAVVQDAVLMEKTLLGIRRGQQRLALHFRGVLRAHNSPDEILLGA